MTPNLPPCHRCGVGSYDGSNDNPVCPWCRKRKYKGSKEELAEQVRKLREVLRPCLTILTHKAISPPMSPGVQDRLAEGIANVLKETE